MVQSIVELGDFTTTTQEEALMFVARCLDLLVLVMVLELVLVMFMVLLLFLAGVFAGAGAYFGGQVP